MKTFEHPEGLVKFKLPDSISVRRRLEYMDAVTAGPQRLERMWELAAKLVVDWECAVIPDPNERGLLDKDDFQIVRIIIWTCGELAEHLSELAAGPK